MFVLSKFTQANLEAINTLRPDVRDLFREALWRIGNNGIYIRITAAFRTAAEQSALYAQGRSKAGKIVTNSPAGWSFHNYGVAIDIAPLYRNWPLTTFRAVWNVPSLFDDIAKAVAELGITNPIPGDRGHFQYDNGL